MNLAENSVILTDEEYASLYENIMLAGIDLESPEAYKIVRSFEEASVTMSLLRLMMTGLTKIAGLDSNGEITFQAGDQIDPSTIEEEEDDEDDRRDWGSPGYRLN